MLKWLGILLGALRSAVRCRQDLALENLTLRQELAVLKRTRPRPRLTGADDSSGSSHQGCGPAGDMCCMWSSPIQSFVGTAKAFGTTGVGRGAGAVAHRLPRDHPAHSPYVPGESALGSAADFFTVPTATFKVLFVLIVLSHCRRRILHFNATEHPGAA
jgi:hypothetical protein